jgi:hypothetical protein
MAEVALRETIDADLGTLFEFQADPEASAMAAFQSRDRAAFIEHEAKIKADPSAMTRTIVDGGGVVGSIGSREGPRRARRRVLDRSRSLGNGYATAALRAFLDIDLHRPCTPTWSTTTSVPGACSRSAASYSTTRRRKKTCSNTCSC